MLRTALSALLVIVVAVAYLPVVGNGWVNYDDDVYVTANPEVLRGLSLNEVSWAFTTTHGGNWHPLTWLSHMLDCQWFGAAPLGPHLVNVTLHAANAVLIFWFLSGQGQYRRVDATSGATAGLSSSVVADTRGDLLGSARVWAAALAAALYALHPLRVEAVAWTAERKELLAAFFAWLAILAYAAYTWRSGAARWACYGASLIALALGLLAKPMLVTMPLLLVVLDYWPLCRRVKVVEKLPYLIVALGSAGATVWAQSRFGNTQLLEPTSLSVRAANAAVTTITYLRQTFWPSALTCFYPYPREWLASTGGLVAALAAAFLLLAITATCLLCRERFRWLLAGWLWYLIALVPVIGLVQVGRQAHADRYTYLPAIGVSWIVAWLFVLVVRLAAAATRAIAVATAVVVLAWLALLTAQQTTYWRDDLSLWNHALTVTRDNEIANQNLGATYLRAGKVDEALPYLEESLRLRPNAAETHRNLGLACEAIAQRSHESGQATEAIEHFARAEHHYLESARLRPDWPLPLLNLATLYLKVATGRMYQPSEVARLAQRAYEIASAADRNGQIAALLLLASAEAAQGHRDAAAAAIDRCRAVLLEADPAADTSEFDQLRRHYLTGGR
ncbi:MAG: tetratricopeptide repeat protein [Pirellulales bacterium]|nr:tetratricopeptide repeat protein [Pirellulales bacterium]